MKDLAFKIMHQAFAGKKDKAGKPYFEHLIRVANNAKTYFVGDEYEDELIIIGLLHDLLEDCPEWTKNHLRALFNANIVESIDRLTKREDVSYALYIENIRNNRFATAVKLADLKDNMDLSRLPKLTEKDIERTEKYHRSYISLLGDRAVI